MRYNLDCHQFGDGGVNYDLFVGLNVHFVQIIPLLWPYFDGLHWFFAVAMSNMFKELFCREHDH
jgi:hypothetical protein